MAILTEAQLKAILGEAYVAPGAPKKGSLLSEEESLEELEASKKLFEQEDKVVKQEALRLLADSINAGQEIDDSTLLSQARANIEAQYGAPLTTGFEKREFPTRASALREPAEVGEPGLAAATRPQVRAGSAAQARYDVQRSVDTEVSRQVGKLNMEEVNKLPPKERVETISNYAGIQAAWKQLARENPQADGEQLQSLLDDELGSLQAAMAGEGPRLAHKLKIAGPQVASSLAFKPQVTHTEFPALSDAQIAFLNAAVEEQAVRGHSLVEQEVRETYRTPLDVTAEFGIEPPTRAPTEEEIKKETERRIAESKELPFWASGDRDEILANLQERSKVNIFGGRTYPTGATVEGPVHFLFRSAISPLNAATAAGFTGLEAAGLAPGREKARAARPEQYQDKGLVVDMANAVARNRSGLEEIGELWKYSENQWLQEHSWIGYGSGFLLDLLIPIDLGATELARAGTVGYKASRVNKALTGAANWKSAANLASRQLVSDIPVVRNFSSGASDFRLFMGAETGRTLLGYKVFDDAIKAGDDFEAALAKAAEFAGPKSSFVRQARKVGNAEDVLSQFLKADEFSKYADEMDDIFKELDKFVGGQKAVGVSGKEMTRWLKVTAKRSAYVEDLLKAEKGLDNMLSSVWKDKTGRRILQSQIAWEKGMEAVAQFTSGWRNIAKNLVMVTPRTWATADRVPGILKAGQESAIGAIAQALKDSPVISRIVQEIGETSHLQSKFLAQGWEITEDFRQAFLEASKKYGTLKNLKGDELAKAIENFTVDGEIQKIMQRRYINTGAITAGEAELIFRELAQDFLSTKSLRRLVGAELDLAAQAGREGITERAADKLEAIVRKEILAPMEARSFTSGWFNRNIWQRFVEAPVAEKELSVIAQQELTGLKRKIASLDKKLRTDVKRLQSDAKFRELYGIAPDAKLSPEDALIHLIMGQPTVAFRQWERNKVLYRTIMDFYVLYLKKTPSLGDVFKPDVFVDSNRFLSKKGRNAVADFLDGKIYRSSGEVVPGGTNYVAELSAGTFKEYINDFLNFLNKELVKPENKDWLMPGFREPEKLSFLGKGERAAVEQKRLSEMMAAVYYQTEARRAISESIENIMRADAPSSGASFLQGVRRPEEFAGLYSDLGLGALKIDASHDDIVSMFRGPMTRLLVVRGKEQVAKASELGASSLTRGIDEISANEWKGVIRALNPRVTEAQMMRIMNNKANRTSIAQILDEVDDTIAAIVRKNGLVNDNIARNLEEMEEALLRATERRLSAEAGEIAARGEIAAAKGEFSETQKVLNKARLELGTARAEFEDTLNAISQGLEKQKSIYSSPQVLQEIAKILKSSRSQLNILAETRIKLIQEISRIKAAPHSGRAIPGGLGKPGVDTGAGVIRHAPDVAVAGERVGKGHLKYRGRDYLAALTEESDSIGQEMELLQEIIKLNRQRMEEWANASASARDILRKRKTLDAYLMAKQQKEVLSKTLAGRVADGEDVVMLMKTELDRLQQDISAAKNLWGQAKASLERAIVTETELPIRASAGAASMERQLMSDALGRATVELMNDAGVDVQSMKNLKIYMQGLHRTTQGQEAAKYFGAALRWVNSARYHLLLGYRPRFHGTNQITAPTIVLGTLGGEAAVGATLNYARAADVMATGLSRPGGVRSAKIAVVDGAGRPWTYDELFTQALESGAMRSQASFQLNEAMIDGAVREARLNIKSGRARNRAIKAIDDAARKPLEFAEIEDNIWRMSVIIDSLRKGEDIGVALAKGRISMFDYGSLRMEEKWAATRIFIFYTFTRNSVVHSVNNIFNNPNRLKNALMLKNDITKLVTGEDAEDLMWYAPDWAVSRPILDYVQGVDKETYYTMGPSIVPVEAMGLVARALTSSDAKGLGEPFANLLAPEYNVLLGRERMGQALKPGIIDSRDVAALKHVGAWWAFTGLIGEVPIGVDARVGETTFDGKRWTLSDKGWANYKRMKTIANFVGASTLAQDWVQVYGTFSDRADGRQLSATVPEALGVTTQIGGVSPTKARTYGIYERDYQLKEIEQRRK